MDMIKGKRILITGGTGSFGNAFIDFSKDCDIKFVVFSRDEKNSMICLLKETIIISSML